MRSTSNAVIIVLFLAVGIAAGIGIARWVDISPRSNGLAVPQGMLNLQDTYANVAEHIKPAVVHITTKYENFGNAYYGTPENTSIGSGVIINARQGYILTNFHVVKDARDIYVMLLDGKVYRAEPVGVDDRTDLAVIRLMSPPSGLVEAVFGDSDKVRVGDSVLAVGSPFGLHHTVTAGIISAKGRRAKLDRVQDFLQTDAKIGPGNSGGPLVSLTGSVIGINTAIVTGSEFEGEAKGNPGIGLAVPSNTARWVFEKIIQFGRVKRGYLGIHVGAISDQTAAAFKYQSLGQMIKELGLQDLQGCVVTHVLQGPAKTAGIVTGDVITRFNGKVVKDDTDLILRMSVTEPETEVVLTIVRAKAEREFRVKVTEAPGTFVNRQR